jgi:hypothetical protein
MLGLDSSSLAWVKHPMASESFSSLYLHIMTAKICREMGGPRSVPIQRGKSAHRILAVKDDSTMLAFLPNF